METDTNPGIPGISKDQKPQENQHNPADLVANAFQKDSDRPAPKGLNVKKPPFFKRFTAWRHNLTKKQKLALLVVAILLVAGACYLAYRILNDQPRANSSTPAVSQPTTVQSKLTGLEVDPSVNDKQVTAVMIENSPDARPQAGLIQAGLVFEAIAEGGITRFMALYQDTSADKIGPVRSVRPYYVHLNASFDGAIAHVGGSPDALGLIKSMGVKDLDQFSNAGAYERVGNRAAPHNVYTSSAKLEAVEQQRGYTSSSYTGFEHAKKESPSESVTARIVNLNLSGALYNVGYEYDGATNRYRRSVGGAPHIDEPSGEQISPKVVVAIETDRSQDGIYSVYRMSGSGPVKVFQNGVVTAGTWTREGPNSQYILKDEAGNPIRLIPGQAWVTLVTAGGATFAP